MTVEEGESADLPVYTIDDTEISVASTWSSEKINGKIQEVFQNASNGKNKLATAIGNGATADMTWDQLASKVLHVNYQKKVAKMECISIKHLIRCYCGQLLEQIMGTIEQDVLLQMVLWTVTIKST
mgnify:FL=1|jgi:hypothetical protein